MANNRRDFLKKSGLLGLSGLASSLVGKEKIAALENATTLFSSAEAFTQVPLPYAFNALEPFIDKQTMEIHYTKHHKGYVDKLNAIPSTDIDFQVDDATKCRHVDSTTSMAIRNNLGGHYNHSLFWTLLKPNPKGDANLPTGKLEKTLVAGFKSVENFKREFSETALKVFGSGWCWLVLKDNTLQITTTPNQDNPLMKVATMQGKIILALDVWEHAYYLKHQNKRAEYIAAWWNVVNWNKAEELLTEK